MPKNTSNRSNIKTARKMSAKPKPRAPKKKQKHHNKQRFTFAKLGSTLGSMAGSAISKITGVGDYKISSNTVLHGQCPAFASSKNGMRITHREFISDTYSSTSFVNNKYYINPGNSTLFPWLSTIASSFETYTIHGMVVSFTSLSGTVVNSTGAMGAVIAATEYDVLKEPFPDKASAEAYEFTTSCAPNVNMLHPIECKSSLTPLPQKYITNRSKPSDLESDDDPRLHYHGLSQLMTQGQAADKSSIGEWHISYDISLYTPRLPPNLTSNNDVLQQRMTWGENTNSPVIWPTHTFSVYNPQNVIYKWEVSPGNKYVPSATTRVPGYYEFTFFTSNTDGGGDLTFQQGYYTVGCTPYVYVPSTAQDQFNSYYLNNITEFPIGNGTQKIAQIRCLMNVDSKVYFPSVFKNSVDDSNGVITYSSVRLGNTFDVYQTPVEMLRVFSVDVGDYIDATTTDELAPGAAGQNITKDVKNKSSSRTNASTPILSSKKI